MAIDEKKIRKDWRNAVYDWILELDERSIEDFARDWWLNIISQEVSKAREEERKTHISVYRWLLGYTLFPSKPEGGGNFWWRKNLRKSLESIGIDINDKSQ